jgi:zinc protease
MTDSKYSVSTLANGLTVITEERRHAPVVSFWMGFRAGSRNELPGLTGVSHWIEHMLFKSTEQFPGNERDRVIAREGGVTNAFTWIDCTAYYTTIPSPQADLVYRIEADRLANSVFDPSVFETERAVILAERDSYANQPDWRLSESVTAMAFQAHPYRHEVIGLATDIQRLSRDDLFNYHQAHYVPNNAVAVAVGDFDSSQLNSRLEELFGAFPPGATPSAPRAIEPEGAGERRVLLDGPGSTGYMEIAYRAPEVRSPDFVPTLVLGSILGSPIALGFGGGVESRSSRLYRGIVETELAIDIDCNMEASIDPFVFDISAVLRTGRTHEEVETAVLRILDEISEQPVTDRELARAKKQILAQFVFTNERITNRAMILMLGFTVFPLEFLDAFPSAIAAVTADDVRDAARKLLRKQNRVIGWYVPQNSEDDDDECANDDESMEQIP